MARALMLGAFLLSASMALGMEVAKTPNGQRTVDVTVWGTYGIPRVRLYPAGWNPATDYEVTDSVVASEGPAPGKVCSGPTFCEITGLANGQKLSIDMSAEEQVVVKYSVGDKLIVSADLHVKENAEAVFRFPSAERFYGIPEHAVDLSLEDDKEYRLMNLDVFHYKLDDGGGIYGSIPFLMAHSTTAGTSGIFWHNSADTLVKFLRADPANGHGRGNHWISQAGIVDVFFLPGSSPADVQTQHSSLTGPVYMPPEFSLGYHQCRWNYRSTEDSLDVDNGFDVHNIPYDVLWLDIEHTDGKKYFTWDLNNFPEPKKLVDAVAAKGRKMVTITDPHIKRENGYHVHDQASDKGFYVKNENGDDFSGHCWPGTSSWVDFYNKNARDWYATLFKYDSYSGSTPDLYSWIDMNEPSVFNAHEVTMDRNLVHTSAEGKKVKHVQLHNMYGFYHTMAAYQGHLLRNSEPPYTLSRPFILTRSFFSGSQRYAAMWTGDNKAEWGHLVKSMPMVLTLAISNFPFAGADVGGFFFNPPEKLMVRWYQAGVFYPFFRGHAHLETKRREPWLFGEENTNLIRSAISLRYTLLPYLYGTFYTAHKTGGNIVRPLFYEFPTQSAFLDEQQAFMFGDSFLVRPITEEHDVDTISINLPSGQPWYYLTAGGAPYAGGVTATVPAGMDQIPRFLRGGKIVPTKERLRRSSAAMREDPITLSVGLTTDGTASGSFYQDDGLTYAFEQEGGSVTQTYKFEKKSMTATATPATNFKTRVVVERIVLYGVPDVTSGSQVKVSFKVDGSEVSGSGFVSGAGAVVIRAPAGLSTDGSWSMSLL